MIQCKESNFKEILNLWQKLWPKRNDIRPMSSLLVNLDHDMSIYDNYKPKFWALYSNNRVPIGVLSGHKTSQVDYRIRGLYVKEDYRNNNYSKLLLEKALNQAHSESCQTIWTLPRKNSLFAYENYGFKKTSDWFDEKMQLGPNCVCVLKLKDNL